MSEWVTTCDKRPDWLKHDDGDELPEHLCLVILWSAAEPERIGESAVVGCEAGELILGRGDASTTDPSERLVFTRYRPRTSAIRPPLGGEGLSRRQCRLHAERNAIAIENLGRSAMSIDGQASSTALLRPGQILSIEGQLMLLCTTQRNLSPSSHFELQAASRFGYADDFGIVGEDPVTWEMREQLAFCARSDRHVLVIGESGVGKELAAQAIHRLSRRNQRPIVARDAATFPPSMIDAELFGNVANYPNAGLPARHGLIGQANGSTILLDEIAELSGELQAHLLRVLDQGGQYQQLGNAQTETSDFRLIAATNRDPTEIRSDLLGRLTLQLHVPNLMDRARDVPLLVRHLLLKAAEASPGLRERYFEESPAGPQPRLAPELIRVLMRHRYRNNVRELDAILCKALAESPRSFVTLGRRLRDELGVPAAADPSRSLPMPTREPSPREIVDCLDRNQGNVVRAAQALGLSSRYALYRLMRKHGIAVEKSDPNDATA